jgi:putative tryptophan/tyrosine transport system substrate-binding protein
MLRDPLIRKRRHNNSIFQLLSTALIGSLLLCGCSKPIKAYRIGILSGLDVFASTVDGFKQKMTELGYREGENISYVVQKTNAEPEAERLILKKFVEDKVDLILVFPSEQAVLAKQATAGTDIPVVFCQTNIEGTNLINTVREPGGNITGVRYPGPDLAVKRFEILTELAPQAKRLWVPYSKDTPIVPDQLARLRPAAASAGIRLVETPVTSAAELEADLFARSNSSDIGIDAILLISEPLARTPAVFPKIGKFAAEHKLPIGGVQFSLDGYTTLFGVATDNLAVGKLAAQQADKVLKGSPAGTIPITSAESFFQLNYKVAQDLGLAVPTSLLRRANEIIR